MLSLEIVFFRESESWILSPPKIFSTNICCIPKGVRKFFLVGDCIKIVLIKSIWIMTPASTEKVDVSKENRKKQSTTESPKKQPDRKNHKKHKIKLNTNKQNPDFSQSLMLFCCYFVVFLILVFEFVFFSVCSGFAFLYIYIYYMIYLWNPIFSVLLDYVGLITFKSF